MVTVVREFGDMMPCLSWELSVGWNHGHRNSLSEVSDKYKKWDVLNTKFFKISSFGGVKYTKILIILESHITAKTFQACLCFVLICRDLRGNKFECDCKAKWLYLWLKMTNSTVSDVLCIGPPEYQEKKLNDVTSFDYECTTTGTQHLYHWRLLFRISLHFPFRFQQGGEKSGCQNFLSKLC